MYCELFPRLDDNVLVLTANQRLAEHLLRDIEREQSASAWPTTQILPFNTWLTEQWEQCPQASGLLLSPDEETLLWQSILRNDEQTKSLLQVNSTANLAKQAWQTLKQWQLSTQDFVSPFSDEIAKFCTWVEQFEQFKQTKQLVCHAELPQIMGELIQQKNIKFNKQLILVGFDEFPPNLKHLIDTMSLESELSFFNNKNRNKQISRIELTDGTDELTYMAQWAKQQLDHKKQKIGCIIPKLNSQRDQVARIFNHCFTPSNIIPGLPKTESSYNLSAGVPFNKIPIIETALALINLNLNKIPVESLSQCLLSPYIGENDEERALAAMTDVKLNQLNQLNVNHKIVSATLNALTQSFYPESTLATRWQNFCSATTPSGNKSYASWVEIIQIKLKAFGWPIQPLTSEEYQVVQRWNQLLTDMIKLDRLFTHVNKTRAIHTLQEMSQSITFQAQSPDRPIQILGTLEASGSEFDAIWIMGLDDENWPPKASPSPFIPIDLQRTQKMPHSSAEREQTFCNQIQNRLVTNSETVIISSAKQDGEKQLRPSQLIREYPTQSDDRLAKPDIAVRENPIKLEEIIDNQGPEVNETESIKGGSWILQQQALCPFRAFASIRLNATPLETPEIGLPPTERGTLCHHALDSLWKQLKSQENLLAQQDDQLQTLISQSVTQACKASRFVNSNYMDIEKRRLQKLLSRWLDTEKKRPPFNVVERETTRHISIGQLDMQIQIDRIDELDNGQQFIIDYKTGKKNHIADWLGERPAQPQLPIYCLYGSDTSIGLAYAEVNLSTLVFKGLISTHDKFSALKSIDKVFDNELSWGDLKNHWKTALTQLSNNFCNGDANVDPLNDTTCQYCDLYRFCRIGH